jgi:hypothetical protein
MGVMKNLRDAFLRTVAATVVWEVLTYPFVLRVGSHFWRNQLYDLLAFFMPVFISMILYNLTIARFCKKP